MGEVSRGNPFGSVQVQRSPCNACYPDNDDFRDEQNFAIIIIEDYVSFQPEPLRSGSRVHDPN